MSSEQIDEAVVATTEAPPTEAPAAPAEAPAAPAPPQKRRRRSQWKNQ